MSTSRETFQCCWNPVSSVSLWTLVAILVLLLTKAYPEGSCLTSLSFRFLVYANNNYLIVLLKGLEGVFTEIWSTVTGAITGAVVVRMWLERAVTSRQWLDLNPVPRAAEGNSGGHSRGELWEASPLPVDGAVKVEAGRMKKGEAGTQSLKWVRNRE